LFSRFVWLLAGTVVLVVVVGFIVQRLVSGQSLRDDVARIEVLRVLVADSILREAVSEADSSRRLDALELGLRKDRPTGEPPPMFFWNDVAEELARQFPGRSVGVVGRGSPQIHISALPPAQGWIVLPVGGLREVSNAGPLIALIAIIAIILACAAWQARRLTLPLRQLAQAAPHIAAGIPPPALPGKAARELVDLGAALARAAEAVRTQSKERGLVLATLSHDMRTPLARLRLASEIAELDAQTRDDMHADIEELDALIGQGIAAAREGPDEAVERVDLVDLLHALVLTWRRSGIEWSLEGAATAWVRGKPQALRRAFGNLMENARHHGRPPFALRIGESPGVLRIEVLDCGPGADGGILDRLGRPFLRASTLGGVERCGLGLAGVVRIVEEHAGEIDFHNRETGGFAAIVQLPSPDHS
jgi:two-component system osmolarity sensor histidine kinase EnvZ